MSTSCFERFRSSFFEDADSARNGLDIEALAALEDDERVRVEDMLLRYLPDIRGVIGLGVLRSQRAEPALRELFEGCEDKPDDSRLIYIAAALWKIRPATRWLDAVTQVLTDARNSYQRMDAAVLLHEFRTPGVVAALIGALDDPDGLVRHHAARGLLKLHDLASNSNDTQHMIYRVMSDDAARRDTAKQDVLAAIDGRAR